VVHGNSRKALETIGAIAGVGNLFTIIGRGW